MRIYLIGLPGSGKTTLAKLLSQKLKYHYIDMDLAIEARENKKINDIFRENGEAYFRKQESRLLEELVNIDDVVIACGGGICLHNAKNAFKGLVIYLNVSVTILEQRLMNDDTRPLLKRNSIYQLAKQRENLYQNLADLVINNLDLNQAIKEILDYIGYENTSN